MSVQSCVSNESYIIIFIISIVAMICFLLYTVYTYDRFNKATIDVLDKRQANTSRNIAAVGMSVSIVFICVLFIIFFGFTHKIKYQMTDLHM
jgi:formate hydrogenlyase subunit 3/multisubunit Na+/H+ antiporter MnhD subunit